MAAKKFAGVRWTAPFSIPAALSTPLSLSHRACCCFFFILIRTFTIAINSLHPSQNIELVFRLFRFYSSLYLSVILLGSNSRRKFIVQYFVVHLVYLPCFYFVFTGSCGSWSRSHLANTIAAMIHCVPKLDLYCAPLPKNSASPISIMTLHCCVWTIVCRSPISFDRFVCQPMRVRVVDPSLFFVWDEFFDYIFSVLFFHVSTDDLYVKTKGIATGWGTLKEDGKPSCLLQEVEVPVLDNETCIKDTNYTQKMITGNMMCAGYPGVGKKDSCQVNTEQHTNSIPTMNSIAEWMNEFIIFDFVCFMQGDSGGPLITVRKDKRYELIGVVSWGNII